MKRYGVCVALFVLGLVVLFQPQMGQGRAEDPTSENPPGPYLSWSVVSGEDLLPKQQCEASVGNCIDVICYKQDVFYKGSGYKGWKKDDFTPYGDCQITGKDSTYCHWKGSQECAKVKLYQNAILQDDGSYWCTGQNSLAISLHKKEACTYNK